MTIMDSKSLGLGCIPPPAWLFLELERNWTVLSSLFGVSPLFFKDIEAEISALKSIYCYAVTKLMTPTGPRGHFAPGLACFSLKKRERKVVFSTLKLSV